MKVKLRIRNIFKKIWRRVKRYLEHDEVRILNQLDRYKSPVISIGDYTYGHPDTQSPRVIYFGEKNTLRIGKFCSIADNVTIFMGGYHRSDFISTYPFFVGFNDVGKSDILVHDMHTIIGNDVWIGINAIIMAGVTIGNGAIIASGSIVSSNVEPYSIVGGNPAKLIRKRFTEAQIQSLEAIAWWNWPVEKIKAEVAVLNSNNITDFINKNS